MHERDLENDHTMTDCDASERPDCDLDSKDGNKKDREARQPFPIKVYEMLEDADQQNFDNVVSWNPDGTGFMVHKKEIFTDEIIPQYFNQTKYKSFQRQLSLYGFQRITVGPNKGLRYHEKLRRGQKKLCREMKPVGYKPRGVEQREKKQVTEKSSVDSVNIKPEVHSPSEQRQDSSSELPSEQSLDRSNSVLPAVVSSNSLDKDAITRQGQTHHVPMTHVHVPTYRKTMSDYISANQKVISTNDIGFFEGMPFYLMKTVQEPETTETLPQPRAIDTNISSGQTPLTKAWEIGFQVAMTMHHTPSEVETSCIDPLDIHAFSIPG